MIRTLVLTPPAVQRTITLQGRTIIPLGTTERGWSCTLVEQDGLVTALVHDGCSNHEGRPCHTREEAAEALVRLVCWMEDTAEIARYYTAQNGSN